MKTRSVATATIVALTIAVGLPAFNWAQDAKPEPDPDLIREHKMAADAQETAIRAQLWAIRNSADAEKLSRKAAEKAEIQILKSFPKMKVFPRHLTQIQEAAEYYCDAKDEADKEKALKRLHDLASKYFEDDMEVRKKELADIEARLEKLRSQLERRRAKKDEIVDLQVKVAINEAEGLGFTSAAREDFKFNFRVAAPVMVAPEAPKFDVVTAPTSSDLFGPPVRVEAAIPVPPSPPAEGPHPLSIGDKGDAVRVLQKALNEKLQPSPDLAIDGDFGPETEKALRDFQAQHDLKASGVVDQKTREEFDNLFD